MRVAHPAVHHGHDDPRRARERVPGIRRVNISPDCLTGGAGVHKLPARAIQEIRIVGLKLRMDDMILLRIAHQAASLVGDEQVIRVNSRRDFQHLEPANSWKNLEAPHAAELVEGCKAFACKRSHQDALGLAGNR